MPKAKLAAEKLEIYVVVSFHRGGSESKGDESSEEVFQPLVAGCHCFLSPERQNEDVDSTPVEGAKPRRVNPSEAARDGPGAFELFKMFGEKRMRLSAPFLYPELTSHKAVTYSPDKHRERTIQRMKTAAVSVYF